MAERVHCRDCQNRGEPCCEVDIGVGIQTCGTEHSCPGLPAASLEAAKKIPDDLIGLCPHGYLLCFYCWRDAGFPGQVGR